ncbi:hypothetical protein RirG_135920 [Rhizophagus irregularis DAOM 197198w]|uniref:Uncharacterized protein n=1 Tax=Rhizophagus irregularis (strain DAOM 197198w) TaxID=1432141 RepID=A0A015MEG3_RHIIW|nr:hypothetical protein RirG_135920 [Rhizophagus irregularis DAOM 197198w]
MNSSFRFLGVWFNVAGSRNFVRKQVARECNSFAATIRPAKLSTKQVVYLHNTVLIPKLEYRMQVTHLSESECASATNYIDSIPDLDDEIKVESSIKTKLLMRNPSGLVSAKGLDKEGA